MIEVETLKILLQEHLFLYFLNFYLKVLTLLLLKIKVNFIDSQIL